jgi:hypothetical protein
MPQSAIVRVMRWIELAHGGFAFGRVLFAVKVFRDDDLGREHRPGLWHFDVFLLEDDLAAVVGDFGGAALPFDLVERLDLGVAEDAFDGKGLAGGRSFAAAHCEWPKPSPRDGGFVNWGRS